MKQDSATSALNLDEIFPFPLDEFQKEAIAALAGGKSVVVCAPTGSGKTVIGEYAIYRALARGKRVFYTTPLKALSNQKFRDFQEQFGRFLQGKNKEDTPLSAANVKEVGLITGDIVINPDAAVVVMTTEIFRNMLYETPIGQVGTSLEDVEIVVLDECHYISDRGRGTVWEESIIYCPPTIQLVALSATIGNPEELTDWINQVRVVQNRKNRGAISTCELVNSDFRPVPLRFHFSTKEGLFPLLNSQQTFLNSHLKSKRPPGKGKRMRREDCPSILKVVEQLRERELLPAIYVIFSRRGCEQAVQELRGLNLVNDTESQAIINQVLSFFFAENVPLQDTLITFFKTENPLLAEALIGWIEKQPQALEKLWQLLTNQPETKFQFFQFLAAQSGFVRTEQIEPITRGIAAHHAGILPLWKEFAERLFEMGLVKVIFATATLSAGINMPARTTVISALSKRTDDGHSMLTPSEFLQIAGRAGRRGMDEVGYVVTVQTPFEGAKEAAFLATAQPEALRSCFTPSYGMVLNLLQKHSLEESKALLESSFAEYLSQLKLEPEKHSIAQMTSELARLDVELAGIEQGQLISYEKLNARLKEEQRLLKILQQQAETNRKQEITPLLLDLNLGSLLELKGKYIKVSQPLKAVLVAKMPGFGKAPELLCLGEDNRWYRVSHGDVYNLNSGVISTANITSLSLPNLESLQLGQGRKGDEESNQISRQIREAFLPVSEAPEVSQQKQRVQQIQTTFDNHPLQKQKNPTRLIKQNLHRLELREQLHKSQVKYQKQQSRKSYYWEEFLNLIKILQEFNALEGYAPTPLGEACATIRGENELWLGLAIMSGKFDEIEPHHLAGATSALITENLRPDTWTNYRPSPEILATFRKTEAGDIGLKEIRRQLYQTQTRYEITIPVWLELELMGLIEQWALGANWHDLCERTSLDEGDLVRLLRRTIDLLWQIPQIPGISPILNQKARIAITNMKRFPL